MFSAEQLDKAHHLLERCRAKGVMLATAESCTGGLISALLTEIAGSSDVVDRGFVAYSNAAKCELLGVGAALICEHGAVSEAVAQAMAKGAIQNSAASLSIAVTGIAGPSGGSADKSVGLVYLASAMKGRPTHVAQCQFGGDRHAVRMAAVDHALAMLMAQLVG